MGVKHIEEKPFSDRLEVWLKGKAPKTVDALNCVFAEKSIGIIIFVLMFLPALPLPTGGVSHVFEVISMLLALQLIIGRRTIWFPKRWAKKKITGLGERKTVLHMLRVLRWLEKFSRPRLRGLLQSQLGLVLTGVLLFIFTAGAFLAPPFSGLDTLPSMGACLIALSLVLDDIALLIAGTIVGVGGIALTIGAGTALISLLHRLF